MEHQPETEITLLKFKGDEGLLTLGCTHGAAEFKEDISYQCQVRCSLIQFGQRECEGNGHK